MKKKLNKERPFERAICSSENLKMMLNYNKEYDDYDEWILVGGCLKGCSEKGWINENEVKTIWDQWSSQSEKFNQENSDRKWSSLTGEGSGIGHLFKHFKEEGGGVGMLKETSEGMIKQTSSGMIKQASSGMFKQASKWKELEPFLEKDIYEKTLNKYQEIKSLTKEEIKEKHQTKDRLIGMSFWNDDEHFRVFMSDDEGKYKPEGRSMTKEEILSTNLPLEFIKINDYKDDKFSNLSREHLNSFRFMMFEIDKDKEGNLIPIEEQIKQIWSVEGLKKVIRKITYSGGKSLHVLCESGVETLEEYQNLSKDVYDLLKDLFKLNVDRSCRNPDRSSRISGFWRRCPQEYQGLIYYNTDRTIGNLKQWVVEITEKYRDKDILEDLLNIIRSEKGWMMREKEIKNLLKFYFNGRCVETKGRKMFWNGEFYEEMNEDLVKKVFYQEIKEKVENYDQQINFTRNNIIGGVKGFWNELKCPKVEEIDNPFCYTLKNGVFNVLTGKLEKFNKERILTSKLNFNLKLEKPIEELERLIKEKVYYWWRKQISWEDFKRLMYLHITRVNYRRLKFILMISGSTNTGKSSFNNLLNEMTSGKVLIKSGVKNSSFMLSGVEEETKVLQYEDSQLKDGFHLIKQLIGNKVIGVENKGINEKMVCNKLFVKILSNLNKNSYPEFFHTECQYFADKLWNVMFNGKISEKEKETFYEMGGEDQLIKEYGDDLISYFLRTSREFIENPRTYLKEEFGENLIEIYQKLINVFLDQYYYHEEVKKTSRRSVNLNKVYQMFKMYLTKMGVSFSEFGREQFLNILKMNERPCKLHYQYKGGDKKNYLSTTFLFLIKGGMLFSLEEREGMEGMIEALNREECPLDIRTGEWKEEEEEDEEVN